MHRSLLVAAALLIGAPVAQGAAEVGVLARPAEMTGRATSAVLLSLAGAGSRVVAVGERGIVLLSDDGAAAWSQAAVPVSTTLTAVKFIDAQRGWAVGHADGLPTALTNPFSTCTSSMRSEASSSAPTA